MPPVMLMLGGTKKGARAQSRLFQLIGMLAHRTSGIRIGARITGRILDELLPVPNTKDFGRTTTISMLQQQERINHGCGGSTERTAKQSSAPRSKITASLWSTSWDNGGRRRGFLAFGDGRLLQLLVL